VLTPESVKQVQRALSDAQLDGWLIFDFHGLNPVALGLLGLQGMATRRIFVLIPREGVPVAITHAIEQGPWRDWPSQWGKTTYSGWRTLESQLHSLVNGKRVAMEYSPGDGIPYLDRVPAGVLEMVRAAGATVVSSGELVTRFYAVWTDEHLASHQRAAEAIAVVAKNAGKEMGEKAAGASPISEYDLARWILDQFSAAGLETDHGPIVAIGANASNPHYEPSAENSPTIKRGDMVLIDLWAREPNGVFADQTWMFSVGPPSDRNAKLWLAVRDARDAGIALLKERIEGGQPVRGGEVDDATRAVINPAGSAITSRIAPAIRSTRATFTAPARTSITSRPRRPTAHSRYRLLARAWSLSARRGRPAHRSECVRRGKKTDRHAGEHRERSDHRLRLGEGRETEKLPQRLRVAEPTEHLRISRSTPNHVTEITENDGIFKGEQHSHSKRVVAVQKKTKKAVFLGELGDSVSTAR
jgi:Xaa-Pro aminopeptidase